jgi:chromosome segregation protein
MRLTKLELNGFKSFARKRKFVSATASHAIIGPNGSGKSNISDAVRWVLGEQSAKALRGTRMEDVIFNGTQLRKALAYSEVTLTFDNSDGALSMPFTEVAVTRRVYRSGESEYCLNKIPAGSGTFRTCFATPASARTVTPSSARARWRKSRQ